MATSKTEIAGMFLRGKAKGYKYMIIVCDNYNFEDYPHYVNTPRELEEELQDYIIDKWVTPMEVYDLSMDMNKQLNEERAWHIN